MSLPLRIAFTLQSARARLHRHLPFVPFRLSQLTLILTEQCNQRCGFCFLGPPKKSVFLDRGLLAGLLDQVPRSTVLSFTGGEPALHPECFSLLEHYANEFRLSLESNGTLFDDRTARRLVSLGSRTVLGNGLKIISIPLNGPPELHDRLVGQSGAHARALTALLRLQYWKQRFGLRFPLLNLRYVVTPENLAEVEYLPRMLESQGFDLGNFLLENPARYFGKGGRSETVPGADRPIDEGTLNRACDVLARAGRSERYIFLTPDLAGRSELRRFFRNELELGAYTCALASSRLILRPSGALHLCVQGPPLVENVRGVELFALLRSHALSSFRRILRKGLPPHCARCCGLLGVGGSLVG